MEQHLQSALIMFTLVMFPCMNLYSKSGPFDGKYFKGRIALSTDGNYNDEDDWAASPVAIAMLDAFGVKDKLVHLDFNCILPKTDSRFESEHRTSVYGAADRYGISRSIIFDCQNDLNGAINNIKNAVNASSADNPLYFILAGPMEVPYRGIDASDPGKRQYVHCISHNRWNDGYASGDLVRHNKRDVIPTGVIWIQIQDQNKWLSTSRYGRPATYDEWKPWFWMRDSKHSNLRWVFSRIEATTRADASDAGMTYFLLSGDEEASLTKAERLLEDRQIPTVLDPRKVIRMEAENFTTHQSYSVEYGDRKASQRLNIKLSSITTGRIKTRYDEPYTSHGKYDVAVRYYDDKSGRSTFKLRINGSQKGAGWTASSDDNSWKTETIYGIIIYNGDEIEVEGKGNSGEHAEIDYLELKLKSVIPSL